MREEKRYATIVAFFAGGLYLALVIAVFGMVSLGTDTEVVTDPTAGPLVGPVMIGAAVVVLLVALILIGIRVPADRQRIAPGIALAVGAGCWLAYVVAAAIAELAGDPADAVHAILFAASQLWSWYALAAGVTAFVVVLLYQLVLVGRFRQRGRPRWPWEGDRRDRPGS